MLFSSAKSRTTGPICNPESEIPRLGLKRAATLILCSLTLTLLPSAQAQTFTDIFNADGIAAACDPTKEQRFTIKNDGAYVAEFEVYSGGVHLGTSPQILLGSCYQPRFPGGKKLIKGYVYTGLVWNPRVLFMTAWSSDRDYIVTYGTTLDARAVGRNKINPNDLDVTARE